LRNYFLCVSCALRKTSAYRDITIGKKAVYWTLYSHKHVLSSDWLSALQLHRNKQHLRANKMLAFFT
jgi:hypothetical protein